MDKKEEVLILNHINDLYKRREERDLLYTCSSFLSQSETSLVLSFLKRNRIENFLLFGGKKDESDRNIIFFLKDKDNSSSTLELLSSYPFIIDEISLIKVTPKDTKFNKDTITHRDILGSLISLGIKREYIGDIYLSSSFFIFIKRSIKEVVLNDLKRIKHSDVIVKELDLISDYYSYKDEIELKYKDEVIKVVSLRLDLILSKVFSISRDDSSSLILKECVFLNGETIKNNSYSLDNKENIRISVKGKGKFIYLRKEDYKTKKDKYICLIRRYI